MARANEKEVDEKSVLRDKPVFKLKIESIGVIFDVVVNGVSVFDNYDRSSFEVEIPINQFITSGDNELELLHSLHVDNKKILSDSSVSLSLVVYSYDKKDKRYIISTIKSSTKGFSIGDPSLGSTSDVRLNSLRNFYEDNDGDVAIEKIFVEEIKDAEDSLRLVQKINMDVDIPRWKYLDSEITTNINDMTEREWLEKRKEIIPIYKQILHAITSGQIEGVLPLFDERNRELDAAFYFEAGTNKKQLRRLLERASKDEGLEPVELSEKYVGINTSYSGKLVTLDRESGKPAITFNFKDAMGSQSYDIWFRKEGDKWIISR